MARYLGWLANAVLFVLCCLFAARTVNAVVGATLGGAPDVAVSPTGAQPAAAPSWDERQVILTRNLFNASLLAPTGPATIEENLEATRLPLTLLGTVAAQEPENAWASIEDKETHLSRTYRVNEEVRAGATVARIERRRVVLTENGSPRELLLTEDETTVAAASPARRPAPPQLPRRAPIPTVQPTAPEASDAQDIRNPATLFAQARILPKYENGAMVGVQLNAIKPGSLFERIGFKNGDVIRELNGIKIDSPEQSAKILLEFVDAKTFNVQVENAQGIENRSYTVPD